MDRFTVKLGKFPVWVWGVLIGVLILGTLWWRSRNSSPVATAGTMTDTSGVTNADFYGGTLGGGSGAGESVETTGTAEDGTNWQWLAQGLKIGTDAGYSPLEVQAALTRYIEGETLTVAQQTIVNAVIAQLKLPPEGVAGTSLPDPVEEETQQLTTDITDFYQSILGRAPDASGLKNWLTVARDKGLAAVQAGISSSDEAQRRKLNALYQSLLGRNADSAGIATYLPLAKSSGWAAVETAIKNSDEYKRRKATS